MPTSTMVEKLIPIWQRVLQLSSIGVDDNFFDVGGRFVSGRCRCSTKLRKSAAANCLR